MEQSGAGISSHIPEPKLNTTLPMFLDSLDEKANIWQQMAAKRSNPIGNSGLGRNNRQISKQNSRQGRQDGFPSDGRYATPPQRWTSHQFQNSQYQNTAYPYQNYQSRQPAEGFGQRQQPAQAALPGIKQPLLLKPANASDSKNQQRSRPQQNAAGRNSGNGRFENRGGSSGKA